MNLQGLCRNGSWKVSRLPGQSVIIIFMAMCKINVSIFCLDLGWKRISLVATMEGLRCVPLLPFQCYRGWGRGEGRFSLCDAADVTEQISAFVLTKPNIGFMCTQVFFIHLGLCQGGVKLQKFPYFVPFLTGTLWKAFSWEGVVVADVSQAPSQLAACCVLEAWPLWAEESKMIHLLTIPWVYLHS